MSSLRGWLLGLLLALGCACLLAGCSSGAAGCLEMQVASNSFVTVLAPDGSHVCDAEVTVDGRPVPYQPYLSSPQDAGCAYAVDNGNLGDGAHEVMAHKTGYLDAHGTIHVSGGDSRACPNVPPKGENITLHLVPTEGGLPDGAADAGASDASSDGL